MTFLKFLRNLSGANELTELILQSWQAKAWASTQKIHSLYIPVWYIYSHISGTQCIETNHTDANSMEGT